MTFNKGQFLNFQPTLKNDARYLCVVEKGGASATLVFFSEEHQGLRQYSRVNLNAPSVINKCEAVSNPLGLAHKLLLDYATKLTLKCKKGSYMSILSKENERLYGIITKGGSKPSIEVMGTNMVITATADQFTDEGTPPDIDVPHEMQDWTFSAYKLHKSMSQETIAFDCNVKYKNKKVISVSNGGYGGPMESHGCYKHLRLLKEHVNSSIKRLFPDSKDHESLFEMDEAFILWYHNERPLLITWEEYIKNYMSD